MAAVPTDILDRIRALEREVRELAGRSQTRPALNQIEHGNVTVGDGGQFTVTPPGRDAATFAVGQLDDGEYGTVLRRDDGTDALTVEGPEADRGTIRIWSRDTTAADRILVMDDKNSDRFLGRPWMPVPLHPTSTQTTKATAWSYAWVGGAPAHNAVMVLRLSTRAPKGGEVRVSMLPPDGEPVVVDSWEIPAGGWTSYTIEHPLHEVPFLDYVGWSVEHHSKSGRAEIETRLFASYTRNTFTAAEAPKTPLAAKTSTPKTAAADATPAK